MRGKCIGALRGLFWQSGNPASGSIERLGQQRCDGFGCRGAATLGIGFCLCNRIKEVKLGRDLAQYIHRLRVQAVRFTQL
jgi:hypothetical protein